MERKTKFDILRLLIVGSGLETDEKKELVDFVTDYEKAEENGMLIHLPCRVGDRTYQVLRRYEAAKRGCTCCTTACGSNTDCEYFNKEKEECLNLTAKDEIQIVSRGFKLEDYFDFGKTVFLTRDEAEQALKQMGE